jgi:hypothetical protein
MYRAQKVPIFREEEDNKAVGQAYADASVKSNEYLFRAGGPS